VKGISLPRHEGDLVTAEPLELCDASEPVERYELGAVYRRHAPQVMRWAMRLSGRAQDAGDITHEVFWVVHRRLPSFRASSGRLTTWLFRITENVVRARRRKERLARFFLGDGDELTDVPTDAPQPDEALSKATDVRRVYRALDALAADDRTLLILFELEGLSGEAIAELTGHKLSNVWVRLHRARKRFLQRLQAEEPS
jgi:RNA polymerase sigma-70 factor, ECF subfamily